VILSNVESVSDLGVTVTKDLSPSVHIRNIVAKATRMTFTIKRTMGKLDPVTGCLLFKG
jgi:hypothetical protein